MHYNGLLLLWFSYNHLYDTLKGKNVKNKLESSSAKSWIKVYFELL